MVLTHIYLKYVSLIYRKILQKVPNGKGLMEISEYTTAMAVLRWSSITVRFKGLPPIICFYSLEMPQNLQSIHNFQLVVCKHS